MKLTESKTLPFRHLYCGGQSNMTICDIIYVVTSVSWSLFLKASAHRYCPFVHDPILRLMLHLMGFYKPIKIRNESVATQIEREDLIPAAESLLHASYYSNSPVLEVSSQHLKKKKNP